MNYEECVEYVLSIPLFASKLGTDSLEKILDIMNHPEQNYQVIHIAGTNGKGSTCSFLASIIRSAGMRVGTFTSPHLVRINERICVDFKSISNEEFVQVFDDTMHYVKLAKKQGIAHPSFFEFMFLMASVYFSKMHVDYVIFETGMGGRLDATNVVKPCLTIITSIGLDHTQFLGSTIEQIAYEKAGIMKSGIPALYFDRKDAATPVIYNYSQKNGSYLQFVEKKQYNLLKITKKDIDFSFQSVYHKYDDLKIKKTALYQIENAILAVQAYEILLLQIRVSDYEDYLRKDNQFHLSLTDKDIDIIKAGLYNMVWPCRMEEVAKRIYVDGAHNEEAIEAFCKTLETLYATERKYLLFAVSKDKDYQTMIKRLSEVTFEEVIVVQYENDRCTNLETVVAAFKQFSDSKITAFEDIREGYMYGRAHVGDGCLFCVGSLYLAGDLLKFGV